MLWNGTTLVKGQKFNNERKAGSAITTIKIYNSRDVDEIIFCDISSTNLKKKLDIAFYKEITIECGVPITIGGGINKIKDIDDLLSAGADKVLINSSLYENPSFLNEAAKKFGSQTIVVGIDFKINAQGKAICVSHLSKREQNKRPHEWALECNERGAGEIVLTSIDNDGCMNGYNCKIIKEVTKKINIPLIASGGAGSYKHMLDAFKNGADAVAASSIYHFTELTPNDAKKFFISKNIPVRKNLF